MTTNRDGARRGSIYLHVLASSLLVAILGLGAMAAVRIQTRSAQLGRDCAQARLCATSAVEAGLLQIKQSSTWRSAWPNGVWLQDKTLGGGTFTLQGVDPTDGVLSDSEYEPLVLTGTGVKGLARHKTQVTLVPVVKTLEALNTCLHTSKQITINNSCQVAAMGAPLSTNDRLVNNGTIDGSVEAASATPLGTITGTVTIPASAKAMPDASLISRYASRATTIPYTGDIDKATLGPGCNPWGPTDPNGLYVLDTGGSAITIKNTRIYGTLIIKASGKTVTFDEAMFCQNYRSQFPVLIVDGYLVLKCTSATTTLSESSKDTNYNPIGAPYEGVTDTDKNDVYPNEIRGLIHVTTGLFLQQTAKIVGTILCEGIVTCGGTNTIVSDPVLYTSPPDGYTYVDGMAISPGSWRQVVD